MNHDDGLCNKREYDRKGNKNDRPAMIIAAFEAFIIRTNNSNPALNVC